MNYPAMANKWGGMSHAKRTDAYVRYFISLEQLRLEIFERPPSLARTNFLRDIDPLLALMLEHKEENNL